MQEINVTIEQSLDHEINGEIMKEYGISDYQDLDNKPSINGVELVGNKTTADLGIEVDTSKFPTREELEEKADKTEIPDVSGFATKEELDSKQDKGDYALRSDIPDLTIYVLREELNTLVGDINTVLDNINGEVV